MNHSLETRRRYASVTCHSRERWYAWPSPPRFTGVLNRIGSQPWAAAGGAINAGPTAETEAASISRIATRRSMGPSRVAVLGRLAPCAQQYHLSRHVLRLSGRALGGIRT